MWFRILRWRDHPGLPKWTLNPMTSEAEGQGAERGHTQEKMRTKGNAREDRGRIGVRQLQAMAWSGFPLRASRKPTLPAPSFWTLTSWTVREYISVILSHQVCGNFFPAALANEYSKNSVNAGLFHGQDRIRNSGKEAVGIIFRQKQSPLTVGLKMFWSRM